MKKITAKQYIVYFIYLAICLLASIITLALGYYYATIFILPPLIFSFPIFISFFLIDLEQPIFKTIIFSLIRYLSLLAMVLLPLLLHLFVAAVNENTSIYLSLIPASEALVLYIISLILSIKNNKK